MTNNLTWVIGNWRIYVAEETDGWRWNCRFQPMGWEISGNIDTRENAIIVVFYLVQEIESGQYDEPYRVLFENREVEIIAEPDMSVRTFIDHAILLFGQEEFSGMTWRLTSSIGIEAEHNLHIGVYRNYQPLKLEFIGNV